MGSLRDRQVACTASDHQGLNFKSCVWRTVSSQSSHHPQEVLLAQFSLYVHKGGLKPDSFHFCGVHSISLRCFMGCTVTLIGHKWQNSQTQWNASGRLHLRDVTTGQQRVTCADCSALSRHPSKQHQEQWRGAGLKRGKNLDLAGSFCPLPYQTLKRMAAPKVSHVNSNGDGIICRCWTLKSRCPLPLPHSHLHRCGAKTRLFLYFQFVTSLEIPNCSTLLMFHLRGTAIL